MANKIDEIIASKKDCYFISPHYDDMAYSASMLAKKLSKTNKVFVINVFTTVDESPYMNIDKAWLKRCNYNDSIKFFLDRSIEDKAALAGIAYEVIDLGFSDAQWRNGKGYIRKLMAKLSPKFLSFKTSFAYRYYMYRGDVPKADQRTFVKLAGKLKKIIGSEDVQVFCPLGVGNHFDHLMTRHACEAVFEDLIYWEDYPYNLKHSVKGTELMQKVEYSGSLTSKKKIISAYKSQYKAMFESSGPEIVPERFYYKDKSS